MASRYDDELWELLPPGHRPWGEIGDWVSTLPHARHALDVGCGDGAVSAAIKTDQLTLADVSAFALDRARARFPEARAHELQPDEPLPFADNLFDMVVLTETIEHVRDVQLLLSEIRRVLEPGGLLALTTPAHRGRMRTPDPLSPHLRFFTKASLGKLLEAMGFDVVSLESRGGGLFALASR